MVNLPDPSQYQVTYGSDGIVTYMADCNSGNMPYELQDSGTNGSMLAEMGPLTLAECGPDSYSSAFAGGLQAVQGYRVQAGGYQMRLVLPAGGGTLVMRAAGVPSVNQAVMSGTILLPESSTLPEDALITVELQDTSRADVPAEVLGEQVITGVTHSSIPFTVAYDPSQIQSNHSYSISVRITDVDGNLLFINDTNIPVITRGNPTENVLVPVIKVNS